MKPHELFFTLDKVCKRFGKEYVLWDLNGEIGPSQWLQIIGPNGCGKSTLLKILAGLLPASKGTLACSLPKSQVAYVGHQTMLYNDLTGRENLEFSAKIYHKTLTITESTAWLNRLGISENRHDQIVRWYSRGMQQRLALGRAFVVQPKVLLLDEPSSGLDAEGKAWLHPQLQDFAARGGTIVHVTHDTEDTTYATHVWVLHQKKLKHSGVPLPQAASYLDYLTATNSPPAASAASAASAVEAP